MLSRLLLAAMHFNENSERGPATKADGTVQYAVRYPRFKHGDHTVRVVKERPSYKYTQELMDRLVQEYDAGPGILRDSIMHLDANVPKNIFSAISAPLIPFRNEI